MLVKMETGASGGSTLEFDNTQLLSMWRSSGTETLSSLNVGDVICLWGCALKYEIDINTVILTGLDLLSYPSEATQSGSYSVAFLKVTALNPSIQKTNAWSSNFISVCKLL